MYTKELALKEVKNLSYANKYARSLTNESQALRARIRAENMRQLHVAHMQGKRLNETM
jgi:hypothetical protein